MQSRVMRVYLPCGMKIENSFTILGRSAVTYPHILRVIREVWDSTKHSNRTSGS